VDVITGLIKANIPTRIAFEVASKIDSRTILDQMGAETLLGQGDMLYKPSGTDYPLRVHGALVSDGDVQQVVDFLRRTGRPDYVEGLLDGHPSVGLPRSRRAALPDSMLDPLYDEAVTLVRQNDKASVTHLQRELQVGYNRAIRLMESLEQTGVVSAADSSGNRSVLLSLD
jgi:S-DNA-T family DNA segregation ATPase FtsK/SpoIIIE